MNNELDDVGFRGNIALKKKGTKHKWKKKELLELKKCQEDIIYFVCNYCKIISLDHGIIPFELYDYQKKFIELMNSNRFVIANQARQSGKSITVAAFFLHYILFNDNKLVALLANKADSAREILGRVQLMYELLPKWLQHGVVDWNKGSFQLENGSRIIASATSSSAIRGKSVNLLYLDEYAFVEKNMADDFMKSVYPTISSGQETKIIITSTPFGMNHFYKLWMDAVEGRNGYAYLEVKWNEVPGRDEKWKEETLKNIGREAFTQEYDIEFIGSAGTLIDPAVLKTLVYREPVYEARDLKIYYQPVKHHTYIMTVDCSEGIGLDYSAASVIDISTIPYQQVAVYRSNTIDPHQLPDIIKELSEKYNDAYTLCELNSTGTIVTSILWNELEFEHLLWCSNAGMKGQVLGSQNGRAQMGLKTSQLSKRIGCSVLKTLIESYQLIINDYSTIQELFAFARDGNTYAAQEGNNDDTVACLFLFGWMTKQTEFQNILESCYRDPDEHNIRNRLHMDALNAVNEMLTPMPIIDDGLEEDYLTRSKRFHAPDPFSFLGL